MSNNPLDVPASTPWRTATVEESAVENIRNGFGGPYITNLRQPGSQLALFRARTPEPDGKIRLYFSYQSAILFNRLPENQWFRDLHPAECRDLPKRDDVELLEGDVKAWELLR